MRSRALLISSALAAGGAWWGASEAFAALQSPSRPSSPAERAQRDVALTGPTKTQLASSVGPARFSAGALLFATALGAVAPSRKKLERPKDIPFRGEGPKGEQTLPLGARFQKFFSIRNRAFWDYKVWPKTYFFNRSWAPEDYLHAVVFSIVHIGALLAPMYFTWKAFWCFIVGYLVTGLFGITLSYHRQLSHRSFKTPKWLEYVFAYCGALALQSDPIEWCSMHRHHHGATDTENDVHSPKDGFWWSHCGWLLDRKSTWMRFDQSNANDLKSSWFYRMLEKTYALHAIVLPIAGLYAFGGLPCVMWGFFFRTAWVWNITWCVNSVSHVWGFQDWNTGDISMNNWIIGILAFGEGWHNNHHAFENSCRHGLKWWQVDPTWYVIKVLEFFGLAWDLKYPSESKMRKLSWDNADSAGLAAA